MSFLTDPADHEYAEQIEDELYDDGYDDEDPDDDDFVPTSEIYDRAYRHFGNDEMAREAATMYPGDFM